MSAVTPNKDGLALEDLLPLSWRPAGICDSIMLEMASEDSIRVLHALAVFEDSRRRTNAELTRNTSESHRIEIKLDLALSLLGKLVTERFELPRPRPLILHHSSVEWQADASQEPSNGQHGLVSIWPSPHIALPLVLPACVEGRIERNGCTWYRAGFEFLSPTVSEGLEQMIFRHHRRQVAIARGTLVERDFRDAGYGE